MIWVWIRLGITVQSRLVSEEGFEFKPNIINHFLHTTQKVLTPKKANKNALIDVSNFVKILL